MKKNLLKIMGTVLSFLIGFSSNVTAQDATTETETVVDGGVYRSWELKAGMKIALRGAMSTNGNQWLSTTSSTLKSNTFNNSCIFEIEAATTEGKFVLKHENQYIEAATNNTSISFTNEKSNAAEFTFSCPTINDNTKQWPNDNFDYNDNMFVRFTTTYNGIEETYLNTNNTGNKPKFYDGTAGFSVWLVYSVGTDYSKCSKTKEKAITDLSTLTDGTKVMFKDMNSADLRKGWLYEREDGNKISTTQYEPTNSLNSSRYIWVVNTVSDGYTFTNLATGRWMRFDNSSNIGRNKNTNVETKNDGEKGIFTITNGSANNYWLISSNGQYFNGDERATNVETEGFNTWSNGHDYEIYPIITQNEMTCNITIQYVNKKGESLQTEETVIIKQGENYTFMAPSINNYVISSYKVGDQTLDKTTTDVEISNNVTVQYIYDFTGFKTTTIENGNFVEPTWYQLGLHNNQNRRYLKYNSENKNTIDLIKSDASDPTDDSQLWCFSGSVEEGFKIYNKKAGTNLSICYSTEFGTGNNKHAIMGEASSDVAVWYVTQSVATEAELSNGFCFKTTHANDNYIYLNQRDSLLSYWNNNGNGSTFVINDVNATTLESLQNALNKAKQYQIGNRIGEYEDPQNALTIALAKAEESIPEDLTERLALENELNTAIDALIINQPTVGKFYHFKSAKLKNYISSTSVGENDRPIMTNNAEEAIFYLTSDYRLITKNLKAMDNYNVVAALGEATTFKASKAIVGTYVIENNGVSYYATETGSQIDRHTNENDGLTTEQCAWIIEEVETSNPITLNKNMSTSEYATLSAPVALTIPEGVKAYTVTVNEDHTKANLNEITNGIIPAGCGVVLKKEPTATTSDFVFTLNSGTDAPEINENALVPLYTETTIGTDITAYILANINGQIGFYLLAPDEANRTVGANKAYLVLPQGTNAVRSILFGGPTTGIENTVATDSEKEEYYDLQGRRVMNPEKGIYITKSGKKVIFTK